MDEDDHVEDDWDVTRTQQGDNIDLFDEGPESHSSTNGSRRQKGDNSDASCGPGKFFISFDKYDLIYGHEDSPNSVFSSVLKRVTPHNMIKVDNSSKNHESVVPQVQKVC